MVAIVEGLINLDKIFTPHFNTLNNDYGKLYLQKLKEENLETIKINDGEFLIY